MTKLEQLQAELAYVAYVAYVADAADAAYVAVADAADAAYVAAAADVKTKAFSVLARAEARINKIEADIAELGKDNDYYCIYRAE